MSNKPLSNKPLNYEEWLEQACHSGDYEEDFNRARQGMVDASDPMIVDLRQAWDNAPECAIAITMHYIYDDKYKHYGQQPLFTIPRPTPAWRPKDGELYWQWNGDMNHNGLCRWRSELFPSKGARFAAFRSTDELELSWDQFKARGDVWEVV